MSRLRHGFGRLLQWLLRAKHAEAVGVPQDRIGTRYGGWWCCTRLLQPGQLALCAGAGEDVSFDVALNARHGMSVLCVDPTPRAVAHVNGLLEAAAAGRLYTVAGSGERYDQIFTLGILHYGAASSIRVFIARGVQPEALGT